jgi:hypothetical protein
MRLLSVICGAAIGLASASSPAATFVIINQDDPGVGLNDPSMPPAAAGCEAGETLGACRLRAMSIAAAKWGAVLSSAVPIEVGAKMSSETCAGEIAYLGRAISVYWVSDFAEVPRLSTYYPAALANALTGTDLDPAKLDILLFANRDLDTPECLTGNAGWWYGTGTDVPADRLPFITTVFGHFAEALGFSPMYTDQGEHILGDPTHWDYTLMVPERGYTFYTMIEAEREEAMVRDTDIVWIGAVANKRSLELLSRPAAVIVNSPANMVASHTAVRADGIGPSVRVSPVTAPLMRVDDGVSGPDSGTPGDGCELPFAGSFAGKIALLDRGGCTFAIKASNAQAAGAVGVVVVNNNGAWTTTMGGTSAVGIPMLGIDQAPGDALKSAVDSPGVNVTLGVATSGPRTATFDGCILMNAPDPGDFSWNLANGAWPAPVVSEFIQHRVVDDPGIVLAMLQDIGWPTVAGLPPADFRSGFESGETALPWALQDNPCPYADDVVFVPTRAPLVRGSLQSVTVTAPATARMSVPAPQPPER